MPVSRQSGWAAGKQQGVRLLGFLLLFGAGGMCIIGESNGFGTVGELRIA